MGNTPQAKERTVVHLKIGLGFAWTKYNRPLHFLSVVERYWRNPDLTGLQLFGKDVRSLLAISCQKLVDDSSHSSYAYGPIQMTTHGDLDLAVAADHSQVTPGCTSGRSDACNVIAVDRVFERSYLQRALEGLMSRVDGEIRTDDAEINLALLSLLLDFGLFRYASLLRLPSLPAAGREGNLSKDAYLNNPKSNSNDNKARLISASSVRISPSTLLINPSRALCK